MIIRPGEYLNGPTLAALLQGMRSVVRVRSSREGDAGSSAFETGFLLTPRLVLTTGHGFEDTGMSMAVDLFSPESPRSGPRSYPARFESFLESPLARSKLVELVGSYYRSDWEALIFRLPEAVTDIPLLRLGTARVARSALSEWIFLLSCPRALPEVLLSLGELKEIDEGTLSYDVNSEGGSSGGPVLNAQAEVIGLNAAGDSRGSSIGISIDPLLANLAIRRPDLWEEVRAHHGLQTARDVRARLESIRALEYSAAEARQAYLRSAAVLWSFEPALLAPYPKLKHERTARSLLLDDVDSVRLSDGTTRWVLKPGVRAEILRELGSPVRFREARLSNPSVSEGAQLLMDRVLSEPSSIDVAQLSTKELEWFRTLVEWFHPFISELPPPEEIERLLATRRLFDPFEELGGLHFRGRRDELARMHGHLSDSSGEPAVLVIHGPGGSGKSSLLARFILDTSGPDAPQRVPFTYLDFDRATLESRKPGGIYAELLRQLSLQGTGGAEDAANAPFFGELTSPEEIQEAARRVATAIEAACSSSANTPFLLALDSFEEAQFHTGELHGKASPWLDALVRACPRVRVFVLGRAPVEGLTVADKPVHSLRLGPLDDESARAMLESFGVTDVECLDRLVEAACGNPLTLRVGATFLARYSKDELKEALRRLPARLVQAVLYDRVLERIHDEQVRKLARPGLVLRRVTSALLREVLAPLAGLEVSTEQQVQQLFEALRRETFLTYSESADVLVHRPELRVITLGLLTHNTPELVRGVDTRAAEYYQRQPGVAARAEELYHRLRLDAPTEVLDTLWGPGVAEALRLEPVEELPERARRWLEAHGGLGFSASQESVPAKGSTLVFQMRWRIWFDAGRETEFGALAVDTNETQVLSRIPKERLAPAMAFAERTATRAMAIGEAGELLRVRLIQAALAEKQSSAEHFYAERMQMREEVESRLKQALDLKVPLGEPVESALFARHFELQIIAGVRSTLKGYTNAVDTLSNRLGEGALLSDPILGRYIVGVIGPYAPGDFFRALELLGLGGHDSREIEMDAEVLASLARDQRILALAGRFLALKLEGTPREAWKAVLEATHHREDAHLVFSRIFRSNSEFTNVISALWKRRGDAVFYERLFGAVYLWQMDTLSRAGALFTEEQFDAIGAALEHLATVNSQSAEQLIINLPSDVAKELPVLPDEGPQLRSNLRVLAARAPHILGQWLDSGLVLARRNAPSAVPTFEFALRTLRHQP